MNSNLNDVLVYADLHVHIFPCWWITDDKKCACGDVECKNQGKHPIASLAPHGFKNATNDKDIIKNWWTRYPLANPALSLAASSLVVIDIDPRNGGEHSFDLLQKKYSKTYGKITSDVEQLTGGGGTHIVYVSENGKRYPGKLGPGVDVKHEGYIMVWPSNHLFGEYKWEASSDLTEGMIPSPAPEWLSYPDSDEFNINIMPCGKGLGLVSLLDEQISELKDALSFISNIERDDWLKVGMAIHSLDSGRDGYSLWEEWSSSCDKFDPRDQARVWFSFHNKADQINKESIFTWAQDAGWVNPLKKVIPADVMEMANSTIGLWRASDAGIIQKQLVEHPPFPVPLLDEVESLISRSGYVNYPDASRAAAIGLACSIAARNYISDTGEMTHVYLNMAATSTESIRYTLGTIQSILNDAGHRKLYQRSRKNTPYAIYESLINSPSHIYLSDDWGNIIKTAMRYTSGPLDHALSILASIYSQNEIPLESHDDTGKSKNGDARTIYSPAMSMLAITSNDQLATMTRPSEIGRGALVSFLSVVCSEDSSVMQDEPLPVVTPQWLIDHINKVQSAFISGVDGDMSEIKFPGTLPPVRQIIVKMCSAKDNDLRIMSLSDNPNLRPLLQGARVTMRRIAIAMAAWANPERPVVTPEIMSWCGDYVISSLKAFLHTFKLISTSEDGRSSSYQQVLSVIDLSGASGISFEGIRCRCYQFRCLPKDKRHELLETLIDDGEIKFVEQGRKGLYYSSRFITDSGDFGNVGNFGNSSVIKLPNSKPRSSKVEAKFGNFNVL